MGLVTPRTLALVAAFVLAAFHGQVLAQCKVLDRELQRSYSGGCKDGLAEGSGEARGLATYRGEFKAGRKHGKGVKTWPSGERYEGDFVEDRKEGTGMYTVGARSAWSGERYTGGYFADRRHGYGVYEWPNGERYAGPWENDRPVGPPTRGMLARERTEAELAAAVGRVGATVCRQMDIGVGNRDIVRGTVTAVKGAVVSVRIDDPGRLDHEIGGTTLVKGGIVSDAISFWVPCI